MLVPQMLVSQLNILDRLLPAVQLLEDGITVHTQTLKLADVTQPVACCARATVLLEGLQSSLNRQWHGHV